MNKNLILETDILDIIFEKRNKVYGAYNLRKFYPNRLKLALGLMLILALVFSALTLLPGRQSLLVTKPFVFSETELTNVAEKIKEQVQKPVTATTAVTKPAAANQKNYNSHIQVVPNGIKTDSIKTLSERDVISSVNSNNPVSGPVFVEPVNTGNGVPGNDVAVPDITTPLDADAVDVQPAYPGGMDALKRFLERNLQNPDDLGNGETVTVRIKFVVGYNGKLQRFMTVLDGGETYNKEVVRVLKKMPDWLPGKARGENVSVYYTIPVKFVMSD